MKARCLESLNSRFFSGATFCWARGDFNHWLPGSFSLSFPRVASFQNRTFKPLLCVCHKLKSKYRFHGAKEWQSLLPEMVQHLKVSQDMDSQWSFTQPPQLKCLMTRTAGDRICLSWREQCKQLILSFWSPLLGKSQTNVHSGRFCFFDSYDSHGPMVGISSPRFRSQARSEDLLREVKCPVKPSRWWWLQDACSRISMVKLACCPLYQACKMIDVTNLLRSPMHRYTVTGFQETHLAVFTATWPWH